MRAIIGGLVVVLFQKSKRKSALLLVVYLAMSTFWWLINILRGAPKCSIDFLSVTVSLLNIFFSVQTAEAYQGIEGEGRMSPIV